MLTQTFDSLKVYTDQHPTRPVLIPRKSIMRNVTTRTQANEDAVEETEASLIRQERPNIRSPDSLEGEVRYEGEVVHGSVVVSRGKQKRGLSLKKGEMWGPAPPMNFWTHSLDTVIVCLSVCLFVCHSVNSRYRRWLILL